MTDRELIIKIRNTAIMARKAKAKTRGDRPERWEPEVASGCNTKSIEDMP